MLSAEEKKARKAARRRKHYEANKEKEAAQTKEWYAANREKALARKKEWNAANKEKVSAYTKKWGAANEKKRKLQQKEYYAANKERIAQQQKGYAMENSGVINAKTAKRRAVKLRATPAWADIVYIKSIYEKAAEAGMHVDHIIPLQGELVCGLHVERNLQLLTPTENISKSNRFDGETYVHILP